MNDNVNKKDKDFLIEMFSKEPQTTLGIKNIVNLDFVNGEVSDNTFIYSKNNTNVSTDGLDVSGSILEVYKNSFINMTDKGLSIGEKSFVSVYNNEVKNNNIGIALKDGSKLCLNQNLFSNNVDDISQYIKKNIYQK